MAERNAIASKSVDLESGSVTFTFGPDPENPVATRTVRLADFGDEIQRRFALNGVSQKLGDCYAGAAKKAADDGMEVVAWAIDAFDTLAENLAEGKWSDRAGGLTSTNLLVDAFIRAAKEGHGVDLPRDKAMSIVAGFNEDARKEILSKSSTMPQVAAAYAAIRAERAAARAKERAAAPGAGDAFGALITGA